MEKSALEQAVASAKEELQQKISEAEALQKTSDEMRSQYEQRLADKREEAEAQVKKMQNFCSRSRVTFFPSLPNR